MYNRILQLMLSGFNPAFKQVEWICISLKYNN